MKELHKCNSNKKASPLLALISQTNSSTTNYRSIPFDRRKIFHIHKYDMHMIHHHNSLNREMHRCEHFYFTEFHKSLDDREKRKRGYLFVIKISNNFVITCHGYDSI